MFKSQSETGLLLMDIITDGICVPFRHMIMQRNLVVIRAKSLHGVAQLVARYPAALQRDWQRKDSIKS